MTMPPPVVKILESTDYASEVRRAAEVLNQGGVVVIPTETVYGLAGRLDSSAAVRRMKESRPGDVRRPLTPHLARRHGAEAFVGPLGELGRRMTRKLWPGPVGLQFSVNDARRNEVAQKFGAGQPDLYEGELITIRCPEHPVFQDVANLVDIPLAARAVEAGLPNAELLEGKADLILDAGPPRFSKPSTLLRITGESYKIVRSGVYDDRIIQRKLRTMILFICSGNTCRSPMAEALARRILAEKLKVQEAELENRGISVLSAGTYAMAGARATPQAVEAVKGLGADLSGHRSRALSVELIHEADAIFVMGRSHMQVVTAMVPSAAAKVRLLDPKKDVEDPIGGDGQLYVDLAGQMVRLIETALAEHVLP